MKKLTIIKIGGNVIDNDAALEIFLDQFCALEGAKILVHGGGKIATSIAKSLGFEAVMIDGRRVTDANMRDVVTMVYGGLVNKKIVAGLQRRGVNAIGLCGADGAVVESKIRSKSPIDYGFVGDPTEVNTSLLKTLVDSGLTPIVAPLTLDKEHGILNTNADTMAQTVAVAMAGGVVGEKVQMGDYEVDLVYKFELRGVLVDVNDPNSLIEIIDRESFEKLKTDGVVAGGMLPKITNALCAVDQGVSSVFIGETRICKR